METLSTTDNPSILILWEKSDIFIFDGNPSHSLRISHCHEPGPAGLAVAGGAGRNSTRA